MTAYQALPLELRIDILERRQQASRHAWVARRKNELNERFRHRAAVVLHDGPDARVNLPIERGSFLLLAREVTSPDGTSAAFVFSGRNGWGGSVMRMTSCPGLRGETLGLSWRAGGPPVLHWSLPPVAAADGPGVYIIRFKITAA